MPNHFLGLARIKKELPHSGHWFLPKADSDSSPSPAAKSSLVKASATVPRLRTNFLWVFTANVIYAGTQWGLLSTLAKTGSPSIVGEFTFALAISAPVFMLTNLQLRTVQATDVRGINSFADYFTLRLIATLTGLLAVIGIAFFAEPVSCVRQVIILVAVSKAIECLSDVIAGLFQREERLKLASVSLTIRGIGSLAVFFATYIFFKSITFSLAALSGVWSAVLIFYEVPKAKTLDRNGGDFFRLNAKKLKQITCVSAPLGCVATMQSLSVNIPRYYLQHYDGAANQGIYASLSYLVVAINLIVAALSQSATTRLAEMFLRHQYSAFKSLLTKLTMLGVAIGVVGIPACLIVGREILTLVYRPEYGAHADILAMLVGVAALNAIGSFLFCGVTAAQEFRRQVPVNVVAVLITLCGSAALIPRWGLVGAGTTALLSAAVMAGGGLCVLRRGLAAEAA